MFHDRFILIDYKKDDEKIYYSGSSIKDAGNGVTMISQVSNSDSYHILFDSIIKF